MEIRATRPEVLKRPARRKVIRTREFKPGSTIRVVTMSLRSGDVGLVRLRAGRSAHLAGSGCRAGPGRRRSPSRQRVDGRGWRWTPVVLFDRGSQEGGDLVASFCLRLASHIDDLQPELLDALEDAVKGGLVRSHSG